MSLQELSPEFSYDVLDSKSRYTPLRLLIEASAGTGKTYTLERIIVYYLIERRYHLSEILIATFTKKATRELRVRIRGLLTEMLSSAEKAREILLEIGLPDATDWEDHIRRQVRDFALAPIHTIHGYAQSVLERYPAESGSLLTTTIDNSYPRELLRDYLRSTVLSGFLPLDDGTQLRGDELSFHLEQTLSLFGIAQADHLVDHLNHYWEQGIFDPTRFHVGFAESPAPGDVWNILRQFPLQELRKMAEGAGTLFPEIAALFPGDPDGEQIRDICQRASAFTMVSSLFSALPSYRHRQARYVGLTSYDDLIRKLDEATRVGGLLLPRLHESTRLILIDEFQDTDAIQWGIFSRIAGPTCDLIAVGDPKQAIYGFRGADLNTYLRARTELATRRRLSRNFRSSPLLLQATARMFDGIFNQNDDLQLKPRIDHPPILAGLEYPVSRSLVDHNERPLEPLQFLYADDEASNKSEIDESLVVELSSSIRRLRRDARIAPDTGDGASRAVEYRDFCVLTQNHKQARAILKQLAADGVPARIAGQARLLESPEADDLQILLDAIEEPGNPARARKLLLTRFYSGERMQNSPLDSRELTLCMEDCARWHGDFSGSGVVAVMAELELRIRPFLVENEGLRATRTLTNYQHLTDIFQAQLSAEHIPASRVGEAFYSLRHELSGPDEESLRMDSDGDCLNIMTMHSSKGLEFPVVYLFGGLKKTSFPDSKEIIPQLDAPFDGAWRRSIDPWASPAGCEAHSRREWEEWLRLFYVAATRARSALILPAFSEAVENGGQDRARGFPKTFFPIKLMYERGLIHPGSLRVASAASMPRPRGAPDVHVSATAKTGSDLVLSPVLPALELQFHLPATIPAGWRTALSPWAERQSSFTSLSRHAESAARQIDPLFQGAANEPADEALPSPDAEPEPAGAAYGILLHKALELLDFAEYAHANEEMRKSLLKKLFDAELEAMASCMNFGYGFSGFSAVRPHLLRHVHNALSTSLQGADISERAVSSLETRTALREISFHARLDHDGAVELPARFSSPRRPIQAGYLTGTIDLLVRVDGRWCIVDWKSNRAGNGSPDELAQVMHENEYHVQAFIYRSAVHQWLCARKNISWNPSAGTSGAADQNDEAAARKIYEDEVGPAWYVFARYGQAITSTGSWEELRDFQTKAGLHVTAL